MYKVLLTDNCAVEALNVFSRYQSIEAKRTETLSKETLSESIGAYDAVIVRSPTRMDADLIALGRNLKYIGRAGVGVDNIDIEAATGAGIIVMNSPGGNSISTAEHTIGLILALARRIPQAHSSLCSGQWDRSRFKGVELYGKTAGVIGLGRVGREVAKRLLAFDMKILAADPVVGVSEARAMGVALVSMEELLAESHFITIHAPLIESTRSLLSKKEIDSMREGVFIINCARGGIIDESALEEALAKGKVAGAACDVFCKEPPDGKPPLDIEKTVMTPHIGAATGEAQVRVAVDVAESVAEALVNGKIRNAVNRVV